MTPRRSLFVRSAFATSALVGAFVTTSPAHAAPVSLVPAAAAVEATPRTTGGDGVCAHFVKAAATGTVNNAATATGLLSGTGTPAQAAPTGLNNGVSSFHGMMFITDYTDDTTPAGNFPFNNLLPWSTATGGKVCESQQPPGTPQPYDTFAMAARAFINVKTPGIKTVAVASDDGYRLTIGGVVVAAFDGNRGPGLDTRRIQFEAAGVYEYELIYWEQGGLAFFEVAMSDDEVIFQGNSTANPQPPGTMGADDLTNRNPSNGLPASFHVLGDGTAGWDVLFVRDADKTADTCGPKVGLPSDICVLDNGPRQCGNGTIDALVGGGAEGCDDANAMAGDGCSPTCTLEPGYLCAGTPSVCSLDIDGDGLTNDQEAALGSDPRNKDTDGDGLADATEAPGGVAQNTDGDAPIDVLDTDDDGDGIPTATEIADSTSSGAGNDVDATGGPNWLDDDADGDGKTDGVEGTGDVDGDGIPNYLDTDDSDGPTGDADADGLPNQLETATGTDPTKADTDGDGLLDGVEDANKDGVVDATETDPRKADTDGGGVADGQELTNGTNPLDPADDNGGAGGAAGAAGAGGAGAAGGGGAGAAGTSGAGAAGTAGAGAAGAGGTAGAGAAGAAGAGGGSGGASGSAGSGAAGAGGASGGAGAAGVAGSAGKAGSAGASGAAGKAGSSGTGGTAGGAGAAGKAGSSGTGGSAGKAGSAGSAGTGGKAGSAGSAGNAGKAGGSGAGAGGAAGKAGGPSAGSTGTGSGNAPGATGTDGVSELEGGCSVVAPSSGPATWLGVGLLAGLAARLRRRRR